MSQDASPRESTPSCSKCHKPGTYIGMYRLKDMKPIIDHWYFLCECGNRWTVETGEKPTTCNISVKK